MSIFVVVFFANGQTPCYLDIELCDITVCEVILHLDMCKTVHVCFFICAEFLHLCLSSCVSIFRASPSRISAAQVQAGVADGEESLESPSEVPAVPVPATAHDDHARATDNDAGSDKSSISGKTIPDVAPMEGVSIPGDVDVHEDEKKED